MGWGIKTKELDDLDKSNERKADRVINKKKENNNHIFIINFFFIQGHSDKVRRLKEQKKTRIHRKQRQTLSWKPLPASAQFCQALKCLENN